MIKCFDRMTEHRVDCSTQTNQRDAVVSHKWIQSQTVKFAGTETA